MPASPADPGIVRRCNCRPGEGHPVRPPVTKPATPGGTVTGGTEYIMTRDNQRPADASLAEDILELRLLTVGDTTGAVHVQEHHNF